MAPEKAPAFQFYPKDILTDENFRLMTHTERGIYLTLLCHCWLERSLPGDVGDLARLVSVPERQFQNLWKGPLSRCFTVCDDGRLANKRLDGERVKQDSFRRRQSDKGKASASVRFNRGSTVVQPDGNQKPDLPVQPEGNSSICNLQSSSLPSEAGGARSKRPVFTGQRLTVFEWMLDDCVKILGPHLEAFDLHEWFFALDAACVERGWVPPKRDSGNWLQAQLLAEAKTRGLPLQLAPSAPENKRIAGLLAGGQAFLKRRGL